MFLCIPLVYGCPSSMKPEGDPSLYICPRCHNGSVQKSKLKKWFELCWIPLIPLGVKHLYFCSVCQWTTPLDAAFQPQQVGGGAQYAPPPNPTSQGGYDVGYSAPVPNKA